MGMEGRRCGDRPGRERCLFAWIWVSTMAQHDARRVVAAELASVQEAAKVMHVTVQGIHKMMNEGRLRYVVAGGSRLPIARISRKRPRRDSMRRPETGDRGTCLWAEIPPHSVCRAHRSQPTN